MKGSGSRPRRLRAIAACSIAALVGLAASGSRARAFGGLWSPAEAPIKQSAQRILLVQHPDSTVTAIVEVLYQGSAASFAWVIPVPADPRVGLSSNVVFQRLDAETAPEYWIEVATEGACSEPAAGASVAPGPAQDGGRGTMVSAGVDMGEARQGPIAMLERGSAGPYDYVTLAVDPTSSDPAQAAMQWLQGEGYALTGLEGELLNGYLRDGLNLLAFKLRAGVDVRAVRPLALTFASARPTIPLRLAALAAAEEVGIQVWVLGPSQAVPENYKSLVLNDARIDWLSGRKFAAGTLPAGGAGPSGPALDKPSNYDALVAEAVADAGGQGFVTELGAPASQLREAIWAPADESGFEALSSQSYADGVDALLAAHRRYGSWDGWDEAVLDAITLPAAVTAQDFARDPERYRGTVTVDTPRFLERLRESVIAPVVDAAALLYQAPYLTRLYTRMRAADMTLDPGFTYNPDLAQVSHVHVGNQSVQCEAQQAQSDASWTIALPQGGVVAGEGEQWPASLELLPANLKVVMLSTRGSGTVEEDNSASIGAALRQAVGGAVERSAALAPAQHGVMIGGSQSVAVAPGLPTEINAHPARTPAVREDCAVSHVGSAASARGALAFALFSLTACCTSRRRRAARGRAAMKAIRA